MKKYKPVYGMTAFQFFASLMFSVVFQVILFGLIKPGFSIQTVTLACLGAGGSVLAFAVIILLINLVARAVTGNAVLLDDATLQHDGKTVPLAGVQSLTLHLGFMSRYRSEPNQLAVWSGRDDTHTVIKRPSLLLMLRLRRLCKQATFRIEGWLMYVLFPFLVAFVATLLIVLGVR